MAVDVSAQEQAAFKRYFSGNIPVTGPVDHNLTAEQQAFVCYFVVSGSVDAITPEVDVVPGKMTISVPETGSDHPVAVASEGEDTAAATAQPDKNEQKAGFFTRIKKGLSRTRSSFTGGLANILIGKKEIDDEVMEDIETQLLVSDVGIEATNRIIDGLTQRIGRKELFDTDALYRGLQEELGAILDLGGEPFSVDSGHKPHVILVVGVNGVGKTTTIGKLAKRFQSQGKTVMLAAGDTFRAAAIEQLQVWGGRNEVPVIAQHTGADSASVIYDAMEAAQSRDVDVLIADTAGRLHTKVNLMDELKKVRRVLGKRDATAPHEVLLVVDAGTGQNAISQAEHFKKAVGVTGIVLTKLDGTAKGGVVFALSEKTKIPIRFIGVGEQIDDLRPFDPHEFVKALFSDVT